MQPVRHGSKQAPQIEFAGSRHHALGPMLSKSAYPICSSATGMMRSAPVLDLQRRWQRPKRLEADAGCNRLPLRVPCPATGAIWVEARGFFRQASALPYLPFIVLPRESASSFLRNALGWASRHLPYQRAEGVACPVFHRQTESECGGSLPRNEC